MSTEETEGPPVYDLTEAGQEKVEADGELRARNPDPNFNPQVNERDAAIQENVDKNADEAGFTPPVDVNADNTETKDVDTEFYVAQKLDPRRLVPGSNPYLDDVERERAEIQRAKIEGREPDLENPGLIQGTPVVTNAEAERVGINTAYVEPDVVQPVPVVANDNIETGYKSPLTEGTPQA